MRIPLDGDWQLTYFPEGSRGIEHPGDLSGADLPTVPAQVPGNVELDLVRAGVIDEPFWATNIRALRGFEGHEWWYSREFELPPSAADLNWELIFGGLDTLATVWVDGVEVGRSANMLVEQRFDVTKALRDGGADERIHQIIVRLGSATSQARQNHYDAAVMSWTLREESLFIRKAAHSHGWDIMPRAVSAGIWRSVWLEERPTTAIEQLYYWSHLIDAEGAVLGVRFQFRTEDRSVVGCSLRFEGVCDGPVGGRRFEFEWPVEFIAGGCRIPVPGARLWWPKGYGEPNLYTVTAQLRKDGRVLAERVDRVGIRTVALERTERATAPSLSREAAPGIARFDSPADPRRATSSFGSMASP